MAEQCQGEQCSVCLSESTLEILGLRCGHKFCVGCLKRCAMYDHAACPTCRTPHLLDPDALKAKLEKYRSDYRSWRAGGVRGVKGEVEKISAPPPITESPPKKKITDQCKASEAFRDYSVPHDRQDIVTAHYRMMREYQTVDFVKKMHKKYSFAEGQYRTMMTIQEAFGELEHYVDSSDPDLGLPNVIHGLQTAEAIRKAGHPDWFVLTGLIHDLGKIMFLWGAKEDGQLGTAEGPQWALGGDTFVVGCKFPEGPARPGVVFPEFNSLNPDMHDDRYNSKFGIYDPHCGIDNLLFAYGHDEYLFQMLQANYDSTLKNHPTPLPKAALDMIRFHSAYPWHTARVYDHLMTTDDEETLKWVIEFNKFDLYTKDESNPLDLANHWPYYQSLIDKYLPGTLLW